MRASLQRVWKVLLLCWCNLEMRWVFLFRWLLDDTIKGVIASCTEGLTALLVKHGNEVRVLDSLVGGWHQWRHHCSVYGRSRCIAGATWGWGECSCLARHWMTPMRVSMQCVWKILLHCSSGPKFGKNPFSQRFSSTKVLESKWSHVNIPVYHTKLYGENPWILSTFHWENPNEFSHLVANFWHCSCNLGMKWSAVTTLSLSNCHCA